MNKKEVIERIILITAVMFMFICLLILLSGCVEQEIYPPQPMSAESNMGWNLVSMPETISKYDVTIHYNNNTYTWQEAVDNGYILKFLYGYKGGTYFISDKFIILL